MDQCKAYWSWICSIEFPIYYPLVKLPPPEPPSKGESDPNSPPITASSITQSSSSIVNTTTTSQVPSPQFLRNLSTSPTHSSQSPPQNEFYFLRQKDGGESTLALERIPGCLTWCTKVETLCPYYNPADATQNGGEPTFLCDESHYQYALPEDSSQSFDCEYGCCFTEQDLEVDTYVTLETTPSSTPSPTPVSESDLNEAEEALSADAIEAGIWNLEPSKEAADAETRPVSLRERCFQKQLFTRNLEVSKFYDRTPLSSFSFTLVPNAFLIVALVAFLR